MNDGLEPEITAGIEDLTNIRTGTRTDVHRTRTSSGWTSSNEGLPMSGHPIGGHLHMVEPRMYEDPVDPMEGGEI